MSNKKLSPELRTLLRVAKDPTQPETAVLDAVTAVRQNQKPRHDEKPRQRSGPKLAIDNPLHVFVLCEETLQSSVAQRRLWRCLNVNLIIDTIHKRLKAENKINTRMEVLRPYVLWFMYRIVPWKDRPPRLNYKIQTIGKAPDYPNVPDEANPEKWWYPDDIEQLDATRRTPAYPKWILPILGMSKNDWFHLSESSREQLVSQHFVKAQKLDLTYYSPEIPAKLELATMLWFTWPRDKEAQECYTRALRYPPEDIFERFDRLWKNQQPS